jgi:hypothetical protein
MSRDKFIVAGITLAIVLAVWGFGGVRGGSDGWKSQPVYGGPALAPVNVGEFRGFSLELHGPDQPYDTYVDEIAQTGANSICMVIPGLQENAESTFIAIDARKVPSDARLKELIALAHKKKLRVLLMPIVLLEKPKSGEWRGVINPGEGAKWPDWWQNYEDYIVHYAKIAQETNTEVFMVGSELISTEEKEKEWRRVIRAARSVYRGLLSYSANWDHYKAVKYWDDLDMIGMTTYYDLTKGDKPTLDRLAQGWEPIKKEILDWRAKTVPAKPLLFTEVGWPNQVTCAEFPWDYYRSPDKPDMEAQANCFEAFFRTWIDDKNVAGMLVWEWRNYPGQKIGPDDTSYVPCGKTSMDVIRKYFQSKSAWDQSAQPPGATLPSPVPLPPEKDDTRPQPATSGPEKSATPEPPAGDEMNDE